MAFRDAQALQRQCRPLVQLDDTPDPALTRYLDNLNPIFNSRGYTINFEEMVFSQLRNYNYLLEHELVQSANIIIIDSWLFQNNTATGHKFTGEEFMFVLHKLYPYIEVIVISQNQSEAGVLTLPKYSRKFGKDPYAYYNTIVGNTLEIAIAHVIQYRKLAKKLNENDSWETLLKEKVLGTLAGTQAYDELKKEDIDSIISAFKEIQEIANGGGL